MTTPMPAQDSGGPAAPPTPRPTRRGWWIAAGAVALLLVLIAAVGITAAVVDNDGDDDDRLVRSSLTAAPADGPAVDADDRALVAATPITPDRAAALAVRTAGGGVVTDVDVDDDAGGLVYEIEVRDPAGVEHDVVIDATSGAVVSIVEDRT